MTEQERSKIPSSFFFDFFDKATRRLNDYPNSTTELLTNDTPSFPIDLETHRQLLLDQQKCALNEVLSYYSGVALESAQSRLRELGNKNYLNISMMNPNSNEEKDLIKAMDEMNTAARAGFVRGVMKGEIQWVTLGESKGLTTVDEIYANRNLRTSKDGKGCLESSRILEFCGLCMAAVRIDNVIRHLRDGSDIFEDASNSNPDSSFTSSNSNKPSPEIVQMRLMSLQNMMLCAVGCHPQFGSSELKRLMFQNDQSNDDSTLADSQLRATLTSFFTAMQVAFTNAMILGDKRVDDSSEGGVTRVVSVQYSEKVISAEGGYDTNPNNAPASETMDEHNDERQKRELLMAKEAASLKQGILAELLSMDTEEREIKLQNAKKIHDDFLTQAMQLPAGQERVAFLQNVDEEKQRILIMHKLWSNLLAKHGGNPPTMVAQHS